MTDRITIPASTRLGMGVDKLIELAPVADSDEIELIGRGGQLFDLGLIPEHSGERIFFHTAVVYFTLDPNRQVLEEKHILFIDESIAGRARKLLVARQNSS